jgi:O-acetyl-ADP-ribose deacetylase (regulator of RNase III)
MSFTIKYGDMFAEVDAGFIMHGCNAQGVMGSGVARIIKERYRKAYEVYAAQSPHYILGEVIPVQVADELTIINAITQNLFGVNSVHADYDAIRQAMKGAKHVVTSNIFDGPQELHMPFIGAGLGGGDPDTIINIMGEELLQAPIEATLWCFDEEHSKVAAEYVSRQHFPELYKDE